MTPTNDKKRAAAAAAAAASNRKKKSKPSSAADGYGPTIPLIFITLCVSYLAFVFLNRDAGDSVHENILPADDAVIELNAWAKSHNILPRGSLVSIANTKNTGRGLINTGPSSGDEDTNGSEDKKGSDNDKKKPVSKTVKKGAALMCVPREMTWDKKSITSDTKLGKECAHIVSRGTGVTAMAFKALIAMVAASGAEESDFVSKFGPWLKSWPGRFDSPNDIKYDGLWQLPSLWTDEQLKELQFPIARIPLEPEYEAIKTHIIDGCAKSWLRDAVRGATDIYGGKGESVTDRDDVTLSREEAFLGYDAFARAYSLAQARWFGSTTATRALQTVSSIESRDPFDLNDYIFLPGIDLANHIRSAGAPSHNLRDAKDKSSTCLVSAHEVPHGEELLLDYGSHLPSRIFLGTYGFLNPDPRSESVLFTLPFPKGHQKALEDPKVAKHINPAAGTMRFEIRRKDYSSLIGFNRFVAAGMNTTVADDCFCGMTTDYPDYDDCGVDENVDLAARETVAKQFANILDSFPTDDAQDREEIMSLREMGSIVTGRKLLALMLRLRLKGILIQNKFAAEVAVADLKKSIELGVPESEWKAKMNAEFAAGKKTKSLEELREHVAKIMAEENLDKQ